MKIKTITKRYLYYILRSPFFWISIVNIIYGIYFYPKFDAIALFDSNSYESAGKSLLNGHLDVSRTPVYPVFLNFCRAMVGDANLTSYAITVQIIVFYIGTYFFYKLVSFFIKNKCFLICAGILYGCSTIIINYNYMELTESFTITGLVIFTFLIILYLKKQVKVALVIAAIYPFVFTMLRPSEIYLYGVIGILLLVLYAKERNFKKLRIPFFCYVISIALLFGYMALNHVQNHYFGLSDVSVVNRMFDVTISGVYEDNPDIEIVNSINSGIAANNGKIPSALETYRQITAQPGGLARIIRFNKKSIHLHSNQYIIYLWEKIEKMGFTPMLYKLSKDAPNLKEGADRNTVFLGDYFTFPINIIYWLIFLEIISFLSLLFFKKILNRESLMIILIIGGQLTLNIIAGPAEFHRLNAPLYPFVILLLLKFASDSYTVMSFNSQREISKQES